MRLRGARAFFNATASAQETDGQVLIGAGIAPLSIAHATLEMEGRAKRAKTAVHTGLGGQASLAAGYGLGSWVFALDASFSYEVEDEAGVVYEYEYEYSDLGDRVTKRTAVEVGPSVRYLFLDGALRPFIEAGAGIGFESITSDPPGAESEGTTLYARGGPGLQLRLADAVSLDLALRGGYRSISGELTASAIIGERYDAATGSYSPIYSTRPSYTVQQLTAELVARLSIWL